MDGITLDILGTPYKVSVRNENDDKALELCSGYCDQTTHELVVEDGKTSDLSDFAEYQRRALRHEIIHAYLFESGLGADAIYAFDGEHPEMMIDWFARQAPKIFKTFKEAKAM